jgi:hypothetical protein
LAPVRSTTQLEYYNSIAPHSPTLLGVVIANQMDAYDCEMDNTDSTKTAAPQQCFEGWINIVDGSSVPADEDLWADGSHQGGLPRPKGGIYANLSSGPKPVMYDQCDPDTTSGGPIMYRDATNGGNVRRLPPMPQKQQCHLFPYALVECCTNPTCYSPERGGGPGGKGGSS